MFFLYRIRLFPNQLFIWNITIVTSINWTREIVWAHLRHCDSTFSRKLLLGFLRGVWIGQVWVEVLVQDLRRLLAEVPPLSSSVKEPGTKDHHCLAGTLLQLDLRIRKYEKITTKRFWVSFFSSATPSHGTRTCIKRKKVIHGKFFDFCAENLSRIRFQEIKIRPWKGFEKMRFCVFTL